MKLLFRPMRVFDDFHPDARAKFAVSAPVVIKQLAAPICERLLRIVRQADRRLPFRRGVTEIDAGCGGIGGAKQGNWQKKERERPEENAAHCVHMALQWLRHSSTRRSAARK